MGVSKYDGGVQTFGLSFGATVFACASTFVESLFFAWLARVGCSFFMAYNNESGTSDVSLEKDVTIDIAQSTDGAVISQFGFGGENADECGAFIVHLFEPSSTTFQKHFLVTARGMGYASDEYTTTNYTGGYVNSTSAVTQASFFFNSGNIDAGTITMYGVL